MCPQLAHITGRTYAPGVIPRPILPTGVPRGHACVEAHRTGVMPGGVGGGGGGGGGGACAGSSGIGVHTCGTHGTHGSTATATPPAHHVCH